MVFAISWTLARIMCREVHRCKRSTEQQKENNSMKVNVHRFQAETAWNTRIPERVALAYTEDSEWRNRAEFVSGRQAIIDLLRRKWARELDYRLRKELWAFTGNRIAVCFEYEFHDHTGQWYRAYGNENWEFAANGLIQRRFASINDLPIAEAERKFRWERTSNT